MSTKPRSSRRRRTGSTARRYQPSNLVQASTQPRISRDAILTSIAAAIVAAALITLIWMVATRSAVEYRGALRQQVEQNLDAQAATLAEKVKLELQVVDQTLTILQAIWDNDPAGFKLADWAKRLPALTAVADDIFIADDKRIIQQDILPQAVGQGIGGAYLNFPHGSLEIFGADGDHPRQTRIINPAANVTIEARRYLMYVVRTLGTPPRLLIGASYRSGELTRHFSDGNLGNNGVVALIDQKQGVLQAVAGPPARRPRGNLVRTDMLEAMRKGDGGIWTGPTGIDGVSRIHAWAKVPGRDSIVIVGSPITQVMAPAEDLITGVYAVATLASGVVIAVGLIVSWGLVTLRANRRRRRAHERAQSDLAAARSEVAASRVRATVDSTRFRALLDGITEAAAVFDADLRLATWNDRFRTVSGLAPDMINEGLPLDAFLRLQCGAGLFGAPSQPPATEPAAPPLAAPSPGTTPSGTTPSGTTPSGTTPSGTTSLDATPPGTVPVSPAGSADVAPFDPEAEIARRTQILLTPDTTESLSQLGPLGVPIPVQGRRMPDGGLVLILDGLGTCPPPARAQPAEPSPEPAGTASTEAW